LKVDLSVCLSAYERVSALEVN